jgi:hypothetical protein
MLEKSTDKLIHMTISSCAIKLLIGDKRGEQHKDK